MCNKHTCGFLACLPSQKTILFQTEEDKIRNAVTYTAYAPLPFKRNFPCQNLILAEQEKKHGLGVAQSGKCNINNNSEKGKMENEWKTICN